MCDPNLFTSIGGVEYSDVCHHYFDAWDFIAVDEVVVLAAVDPKYYLRFAVGFLFSPVYRACVAARRWGGFLLHIFVCFWKLFEVDLTPDSAIDVLRSIVDRFWIW